MRPWLKFILRLQEYSIIYPVAEYRVMSINLARISKYSLNCRISKHTCEILLEYPHMGDNYMGVPRGIGSYMRNKQIRNQLFHFFNPTIHNRRRARQQKSRSSIFTVNRCKMVTNRRAAHKYILISLLVVLSGT